MRTTPPSPTSGPRASALLAGLALLALAAQSARAQCAAQSVTLARYWNAVYLEVSPEATADEVFAGWPVDSVGVYDPASFLSTRQFSASDETQGLRVAPIAMWRRDIPDASPVTRIPAGVVCICFNTGGVFRTTLVGVPAAPRATWHVTDDDTVFNFFGFSLQPGATVTPDAYLDGFGGLAGKGRSCWRIGGSDRGAAPALVKANTGTSVSDGDVLLLPSSEISDWSGPLWVSPMNGLDFGTNATLRILSIRNDGGAPRTVALEIHRAVAELDPRLPFNPAAFHWRDEDVARTNAAWNGLSAFGEIARKRLAAGETWRIAFGLDRSALSENAALPRGVAFGALLQAADADGGTRMKAVVPLRAGTDGGGSSGTTWPAGLWVADVALNTAGFSSESNLAAAGGVLKLRLPLHVDGEGRLRLLQRVVAVGETAADGTLSHRLYAGAAQPPATAAQTLRISSAVLPTETPVIESHSSASDGLLTIALFEFTVEEDGATSLLRHPLHPQHDGLRWDFSTPAPSGDDLDNYKLDVKPETFSVRNTIMLMFDFNSGAARWDPQDTVSGTCSWSFSGLRREGSVVASGPMTLRRVSPLADLVLE